MMEKPPYQILSDRHLGGCVIADEHYPHGDPETYLTELWDWLIARFEVKTMLDVGCGCGHTIKYFRGHGVRAMGIEGSRKAIECAVEGAKPVIVQHDYTQGPWSACDADLIWSCEFVEHVEEPYLDNFLATFDRARRCLAMTHAVPGQPGYHHVTCETSEFWISRIEARGKLRYDDDLTSQSKAGSLSAGYWGRSGLIFVPR